jgi:hypothetical protein
MKTRGYRGEGLHMRAVVHQEAVWERQNQQSSLSEA